jgi:hypothetical protein
LNSLGKASPSFAPAIHANQSVSLGHQAARAVTVPVQQRTRFRQGNYSRKLTEDRLPRRVQVEDAVDDGNANLSIFQRQPFRIETPTWVTPDSETA